MFNGTKLGNSTRKKDLPMSRRNASNVFRGMFTLAKGAVAARLIGIASMPLITRLYSPEDFGILALYMAAVAIISPTLTLRYAQAIPLPKSNAIAANLFYVCLQISAIGCIILVAALFFFSTFIFTALKAPSLAPWWPLIIFGAFFASSYEVLSLWGTRKKKYGELAVSQTIQSLVENAAKISIGVITLSPAGLLLGHGASQGVGTYYLAKKFKSEIKELRKKTSRKLKLLVAGYYKDFPIYRAPSQLLMLISVQGPILLMSTLYGSEKTGQLSLALMALSLPTSLIGNATAKAYYAEIAALGKHQIKEIRDTTITVQKKLFLIGIPITASIALMSESVFVIAFGEDWRLAGEFAAILSPFILLQFTSASLIQVINIVGSQSTYLLINIARIIGLIMVFVAFKESNYSDTQLIQTLSAFLTLFYLAVTAFVAYAVSERANKKHA